MGVSRKALEPHVKLLMTVLLSGCQSSVLAQKVQIMPLMRWFNNRDGLLESEFTSQQGSGSYALW